MPLVVAFSPSLMLFSVPGGVQSHGLIGVGPAWVNRDPDEDWDVEQAALAIQQALHSNLVYG